MNIFFEGKTNHNFVMINNIKFRLQDGRTLTVDRTETEFGFWENDIVTMQWNNVYIWDGEKENFIEDESIFDGALLDEIEVEDDAPEDYYFDINKWCV